MSNSYPSRRELRLQRERAERAKLRDEEALRWAAELEQTGPEPAEPEFVDPAIEQPSDVEDTGSFGRRAAASPVDAPADVEEEDALDAPPGTRRRRRADSEVTSTGMIPIISKPRDEQPGRPRSRREMREIEARRAAERRAEAARAQRDEPPAETKPRRRATAPQTTPISIPPVIEPPVADEPDDVEASSAPEEELDITLGDSYSESAAEITDMSGLDTIEIRRAELRAETERLTQEIMEMGQANPNVIDPVMLRRQKELAEKSKELQELDTEAVALVEDTESDQPAEETTVSDEQAPAEPEPAELVITTESQPAEPVDEPPTEQLAQQTTQEPAEKSAEEPAEKPAETPASETKPVKTDARATKSGRRPRRAQSGPMISGPFDVDHNAEKPAPVPSAELLEELRRPAAEPRSSSGEPLDAFQAHGLDSLDAKEVEGPERRMLLTAAIVFAVGIIALIIAIILLTR